MTVLDSLHDQFLVPVLRETDEEKLYRFSMELAQKGMRALEITLMSESALKVISRLSQEKGLTIGAGTVLDQNLAEKAVDAGARFLVSPGLDEGAVVFARNQNIPFIPGVLTPTEIMKALALGCEVIKVFPVGSMGGVEYLKNLKGPFPKLKVMASGGIGLSDIEGYLKAGCFSVGMGSQLTPAVAEECLKKIKALRS